MARHILGVDVIATNNTGIIHLFDTSAYASGLGITCPRMEITIPGFKKPRVFEPIHYFNLSLNALTLGIVSAEANILPPLPDGVYQINYSVSPNDRTLISFDHLRTTAFDKAMNIARCKIGLNTCSPSQDIEDNLASLQEIAHYAASATAAVSTCNDTKKGMALFTYALKLLHLYTSTC